MKKIFAPLLLALALPIAASAQVAAINAPPTDDGLTANAAGDWTYGGITGLTLSQTAVSNWSGGGANAVTFNGMFNYGANMKKGKHLWNNRLELAYGMNVTRLVNQKTNDKIYIASLYGYELGSNWYASALVNFNTQFANGFNYTTSPKMKTSRFMAPGYLSIGGGFTWTPGKIFNLYISPATWRGTWVLDDELFLDRSGQKLNPYGVKFYKKDGVTFNRQRMRNEFGANVRAELNYDITADLNLYSRLDLFSNYLEKPQNIDVRWDIVFTAKVNSWLSANLTVNMLYDDDIHSMDTNGNDMGPKFQVKEVLGIGLQASF
jgi:hypothetical protein